MQLKDEMLNSIVEQGGNIAQFVSLGPTGKQRFARVRGFSPQKRFGSIKKAVEAILQAGAPFVNIRSFLLEKPDGNPFFMGRNGFETPQKVAAKVRELIAQGYYVIINEEIDINDGGFSGVILGNVAEFATRDTPRCVEKSGCAVLPRLVMLNMAWMIYGKRINIPYDRTYRVEFSAHPAPVGYAKQNQIIWQIEATSSGKDIPEPKPNWPNRVSEDMGDKAYGLLIAHVYGFWVPYTKVVGRVIPPFEFGKETGSPEPCWRRTCPKVQQPGLYTTKHGQLDPFALMQKEDPESTQIAALIFQDDVEALYSGAVITDSAGGLIIEGGRGYGDNFMIGIDAPDSGLPKHVVDLVENIWEKACEVFGPVRFEWCYDKCGGLWTLQLHTGQSASVGNIIYPGEPENFKIFDVRLGLEKLRLLVAEAQRDNFGIILKGNVGITSHFGDLLRRNKIPSRLERE